jgi:hypothetical protein
MRLQFLEVVKELPACAELRGFVGKRLESNGDSLTGFKSGFVVSNVKNYKYNKTKGYVKVKDNDTGFIYYYELIGKSYVGLISFIAVLILSGLIILGTKVKIDNKDVDPGDITGNIINYSGPAEYKDDINGKNKGETIIDGIVPDGETLECKKGESIPLGNNPENKRTGVKLQIKVLDEKDNELMCSPKLKPGEGISFTPSDYFKKGTHNITIVHNTFLKDGTQTVGMNLHLKIALGE